MSTKAAKSALTRRLLGQWEELTDDLPPAIDIRVAGREDWDHDPTVHGALGAPTRSDQAGALLTALCEGGTGAFTVAADDGAMVIRVPTRWSSEIERVLVRLPQLRGVITPAELD